MQIGGIDMQEPKEAPPEDLPAPEGTIREQLRALMAADFKRQLADNPEFATQAGFNEYDTKLQDLSPQAFDQRVEHNTNVCERLSQLDLADASMSDTDRLHAALLRDACTDESAAIGFGCHLTPINSIGMGGVYLNFLEVMEWMDFDSVEGQCRYLERLMAFPKQVEQYCDLLAYGSMRKMSASRSMMRNVPDMLKAMLDGDLACISAPLQGKEVPDEVSVQVEQAKEHCFRAGLRRLHDFVNEFYADRVRPDPGLCSVANGAEIYAHCIRFHTTTTKTAQELHELGLQEVARIEGRFQKEVLDALDFKGTLGEFASSLKADPSNFYSSADELLDGYRVIITEIEGVLPRYFKKQQKTRLEVVTKEAGPAAYYYAGTADGSRPGRFYVNTTRIETRAKYEMMALALHEGVPGHHLQGSLALENDEIPDFMRYIEDRRYELCPARRPLYAAYFEGWALYCESLGEEMGMYRSPLDIFGRLSMEMMRASRLVVDTGIHAFGWTVERAAEFQAEKSGMAAAECEAECHRYAAWPGQALAYKVGEIAIREMRVKAEAALGDRFDLQGFHEVVLGSGPMPLTILGGLVDTWVTAQGAAPAAA